MARRIEIAGDDCGPLADAVTLAVTLAIDPDWSPAEVPTPPTDAPCPRCAATVCPAAVPCPAPPPTPTPPTTTATTAAPRFALRLFAGLSVGVIGGPAPSVGLEGEAVVGGPWSIRAAARFTPAAVTPDAAVLIGLTRFDLGVCLDTGRAVAAGACAGLSAGALDLGARAFIPVAPGPRGWVGAWVEGRVEVRALRPWVVGAQVRAVLPWVRYRAVVEGLGAPSFEAPAAGFEAELSTGVRF